MIKIDKNVPMPNARQGARKYPWHELSVGDSFFVPGMSQGSMTGSARQYANRHGVKFVLRTVTENGTKGVRIWRTE